MIEPGWLTPEVLALARQIDAGQDWGLLPLLADALEDAGAGVMTCPSCQGEGRVNLDDGWGVRDLCPDCRRDGSDARGWIENPWLSHLRGELFAGPHRHYCYYVCALLARAGLPCWLTEQNIYGNIAAEACDTLKPLEGPP